MENKKEYILKAVKASDIPTRGKWKFIVSELIEQFDAMPKKYVEVLVRDSHGKVEALSKKELQALYDAFKAFIKRNNLKIETSTEKGRLYIMKEMRYFVK